MARSLHDAAGEALAQPDPWTRATLVERLVADHRVGRLDGRTPGPPMAVDTVPRPARPVLVSPRDLPARGVGSPTGRVATLHAVAHIEANAVALALDAVHRFRGLPAAFYADWLSVAHDEARHFRLLADRLVELGAAYGDLPAHDGLWQAASRTAHDPLARMALVPRVLEARGLDVTPTMIERLTQAGDVPSAEILAVILDDEVGHVATGTRWFEWLCAERGLDPATTFVELLDRYGVVVAPPFNQTARRAAGFSADELGVLIALHRTRQDLDSSAARADAAI